MKRKLILLLLLMQQLVPTLFAQFTGVGITNPSSRLHINGTSWFQGDNTPLPSSAGAGIGIGFGNGASGGYIFAWDYTSFTSRNLWLQSTGGSVLIGSTTAFPSGKLHISATSRAIYASTSAGEAVYGISNGGNAITAVSTTNLGMYAVSQAAGSGGLLAEGPYIGLQGTNTGADANRQGVRGENSASAGGYAALFVGGPTWVAGTLFKNAGAFKIDHPLDPANKYLVHSFVESPDMKNIYDGIITTNENGEAIVELPEWFGALNKEFRYQLTVIGKFAQAIVTKEIDKNRFSIQTNKPVVKVSWQVTGIRKDAFAEANRIPVEIEKAAGEKGKYIYPQGVGLGPDRVLDVLQPANSNNKIVERKKEGN